jgi:hypothetical protein
MPQLLYPHSPPRTQYPKNKITSSPKATLYLSEMRKISYPSQEFSHGLLSQLPSHYTELSKLSN